MKRFYSCMLHQRHFSFTTRLCLIQVYPRKSFMMIQSYIFQVKALLNFSDRRKLRFIAIWSLLRGFSHILLPIEQHHREVSKQKSWMKSNDLMTSTTSSCISIFFQRRSCFYNGKRYFLRMSSNLFPVTLLWTQESCKTCLQISH